MSESCKGQFESIGTIRYRASSEGNILFFVPDSSHFLEYSGTSYAVFVSVCQPAGDQADSKNAARGALVVPLRNNEDHGIFLDKSVPIEIQDCGKKCNEMHDVLRVALQAARNETRVTVRVKKKEKKEKKEEEKKKPGCSVVELVGITFPAR